MPRLSATTTAQSRFQALDGLRGVAAVGVAVLHVWMFDHGDAGRGPKSLLDHAIGELRLGVPLFFVLSGFLLFRPYAAAAAERRDAPSLWRYALRRGARILPAYWLALAVSFVLLDVLDHPRQIGVGELPIFLALLQNYDPATIKQLDPPMWTLCVEVTFYAVLPLIGAALLRFGVTVRRQIVLCSALIGLGMLLVALSVFGEWPRTVTTSLLTHLPEFAAGMLAAVLVHGRTATARTGALLLGAGSVLVLFDAWWHSYGVGPQIVRDLAADLPAVAGFALIVPAVVIAPMRLRVLTSRPLQLLGTLSYGLYLMHFLAIDLLRGIGRFPEQLGFAIAAVLAISCAAAAVSWTMVERPALAWTRRRTARERRAPREHHDGLRGAARPEPARP